MRFVVSLLSVVVAILMQAAPAAAIDRFVSTSDGIRLHVVDIGPTDPAAKSSASVLVFVPGWTMPEWIFQPQIDEFSRAHRVIAIDPRGQGQSDAPKQGYVHTRRAEDISDVLRGLDLRNVVLVGWSLGVLDTLAYVRTHGDATLSGMVLIDNSVGEDPPPSSGSAPPTERGPKLTYAQRMAQFVRSMFRAKQPETYLQQLTSAALHTPEPAARQLLAYPVPRTYWKAAIYATEKPIFYVVRPKFAGQAGNLAAHHKAAETMVVDGVGHALFVDDPARFNTAMADFLARRVER